MTADGVVVRRAPFGRCLTFGAFPSILFEKLSRNCIPFRFPKHLRAEESVGNERPADTSRSREGTDGGFDALAIQASQGQGPKVSLRKKEGACYVIAEPLDIALEDPSTYAAGANCNVRQLVKEREGPGRTSILIVDDDKRCEAVGERKPSEGLDVKGCDVVSEVTDKQNVDARGLDLLAKVIERFVDGGRGAKALKRPVEFAGDELTNRADPVGPIAGTTDCNFGGFFVLENIADQVLPRSDVTHERGQVGFVSRKTRIAKCPVILQSRSRSRRLGEIKRDQRPTVRLRHSEQLGTAKFGFPFF